MTQVATLHQMPDIVEKNIILLDEYDVRFKKRMSKIEADIYDRVITYLDKFGRTGGKFKAKERPFSLINGIKKELKDIIGKSDYISAVDDYLVSFDDISTNVSIIQKEINNLRVRPALYNDLKKALVEQAKDDLLEAGVDARFGDPIKKILFTQINIGADIGETKRLLDIMITGKDKDGILSRYAGQVARDAAQQYEGHINQVIKNEFNLTSIAYVGSVVKDSRKQCRRWVDMGTISDKYLQKQIDWAEKNGSGMIPGTSPENFIINRGGYNCRHTAYPVRA